MGHRRVFPLEDGIPSFGDRQTSDERMSRGLEAGKLSFTPRGQKLNGSWTLVRTARSEVDWLLINHKDAFVSDADILQQDASVLSGLTIKDLKTGPLPRPFH